MTRGRKPNPVATEVVDVKLNPTALAQAGAAATTMGTRSAEISERYGDGSVYERHRIVGETRFFLAQGAEAMLEAGKRLIQIKENEPHGDYLAIIEASLGIGARSAQLMMKAAVKFLSPQLKSNAKPVSLLGPSKLFVLMAESDDDIVELAEGGTLAGVTIDDMQRMTRDELKAALREAKQTADAKQAVIDKRDARVSALEEQLARPWKPPAGSVAKTAEQQAILDAMRSYVINAEVAIGSLATVCDGIFDSNAPECVQDLARQNLEYVAQCVADLNRTHGIELNMAERIVPEWVRGARAGAAKLDAEKAAKKALAQVNGNADH